MTTESRPRPVLPRHSIGPGMKFRGRAMGLCVAGALALAAFGIGPSAAVEVHETFGPEHYATVQNPFFDIWVIEVRSVDDANATNTEPPTAQAAVLEVLRGKPVVGIVTTVWDSPERPQDLEDPEAGNFDLKRSWLTRPAWGPSKGDRLIVVGLRNASTGKFHVGAARVFRLTEANRAAVLRGMATPADSEGMPILILPALLVIPVVGMILLLLWTVTWRRTRRWKRS